jgi:hypothetical protein
MQELSTNQNPEIIIPKEVFNINDSTDTVISCIQGEFSSVKITKDLISKGHNNYRCLSGGIIALSDYFNDAELSETIASYFNHKFDLSLRQRVIQETGKSQFEYYRQLKGKTLYIITHTVFRTLQGTITQQELTNMGCKTIEYFTEEKDFYKFLKNKTQHHPLNFNHP